MATILLERYCYSRRGTFGEMVIDDNILITVEREWAGNAPFNSCLPEGDYDLVLHTSPRYGLRWHLVKEGVVSLTKERGTRRYACLFHPANKPDQVQGCIAPNMREWAWGHQWGGHESGEALNLFESYLNDGGTNHTLVITQKRIEYP